MDLLSSRAACKKDQRIRGITDVQMGNNVSFPVTYACYMADSILTRTEEKNNQLHMIYDYYVSRQKSASYNERSF